MSKFNYIFSTNNNNYSWRHHILLHTLLPTRSLSRTYTQTHTTQAKDIHKKNVFHTLVRTTWASIFVHNFNSVRKFYAKISVKECSNTCNIPSFCYYNFVVFHFFPASLHIKLVFPFALNLFRSHCHRWRIELKIKINNVNTSCSVFAIFKNFPKKNVHIL